MAHWVTFAEKQARMTLNQVSLSQRIAGHRRAIAAVLLLIVTMGGLVLWHLRPYSPLHAASEQAALVLYAPQGLAATEQVLTSKQHDGVASLPVVARYQQSVAAAAATLSPEAAQWWASQPQAAIFSLLPNDSLSPLLVLDAGTTVEVRKIISTAAVEWSATRFKGYDIYEQRGPGKWVIAARRNVLLMSRFSYMVEEALVQLERREGWWPKHAALSAAPLVAVARPATMAERAQGLLAPGWRGAAMALASAIEAAVVGLWPDHSEVVVRTTSAAVGPATSPQRVAAALPDHAAVVSWHTSEKPGDALAAFLQPHRDDVALRQYVLPWTDREAAFVWLEPQAGSADLDCAWVCSVRDEQLAHQSLDQYGATTGMVRKYPYHAFEIRQFLDPALLAPLMFEGVKRRTANPACALIDGYAVFAPSATALELWIDKYVVSQMLADAPAYLLLLKRQGENSQWSVLLRGSLIPLLAQRLWAPGVSNPLAAETALLRAQGMLSLNFKAEGHRIWRAIPLRQQDSQSITITRLLWKVSLPAPVVGTPQWVPPSQTEAVPLVLVQDAQSQLHCLEPGGHIRWSKALDKPMRSAVRTLENPSDQQRYYLFNTEEALWMLDAQGQEVLRFPLRLQSPATNGVIVVPMESAHRYGLFVACANGNLYGFDLYGRPLPGWNPLPNAGQVQHPLVHFTWANRDYIAALDAQGRLLCADRAGKLHFAPLQLPGTFSANPLQCIWLHQTPYLLCINDAGKVFRCSTSGQVVEYSLSDHPAKRHLAAALPTPPNTSEQARIAIAEGQQVSVAPLTAPQRKQYFTLPTPPDVLWPAGNEGFGVLCRERRQVFLLSAEGRLLEGFPLGGTTPFSLSTSATSAERWLVVGYDIDVYAYRL